ncbi:MAG: hypothetical protein Q9222_004198 [Ikaeria aurantiellina]
MMAYDPPKVYIVQDYWMSYLELFPFSLAEAGRDYTKEDLQELLYDIDWEKNKNMRIREISSIQALVHFMSDESAKTLEYPTEFEAKRAQEFATYNDQFGKLATEAIDFVAANRRFRSALECGRELRSIFNDLDEYVIRMIGFGKYWTRLTDEDICLISIAVHKDKLYDRLPETFRSAKWRQIPTRLYWWARHAKYMTYVEFIDIREPEIDACLDYIESVLDFRPEVK